MSLSNLLNNLRNYLGPRRRPLAIFFALFIVILAISLLVEMGKKEPSSPAGERFSVENIIYSKDKQGYLVKFKTADSQKLRQEVNKWFSDKGLSPSSSEIIILTLEDQAILDKIAASLPLQTPSFEISYSSRMNTFLIALNPPFEENRQKAIQWLKDQGLTDLNKAHLTIGEYQPHGSVGIPAPY